jgi:integrase
VRGTGFHRLRKSSASYVALGGGDATEHLGHASPEMTRQHYLDPRITQSKRALDYLPKLDLDGRKDDEKPPEKPADSTPASDEKSPEKPAA